MDEKDAHRRLHRPHRGLGERPRQQQQGGRAAANNTINESIAKRVKEAAEFATASNDMRSNMNALDTALYALKEGLSASLRPPMKNSERVMFLSYLTRPPRGGEQNPVLVCLLSWILEWTLCERTGRDTGGGAPV